MSKRRSASVLTKAGEAFKRRWLIQANLAPFYDRQKDYKAIRQVTRAGHENDVERTIRSFPEVEFNTAFYKRHTIVTAPMDGQKRVLGPYGEPERLGIDHANPMDQPWHLPVVEWTRDPKALMALNHQAMYWGYINTGSQWRPTAEDIVCVGIDNDFEYFHE